MRFQRLSLVLIFATGAVCLLVLTLRAMSVRGVFDNNALMQDVWFQVTLFDAYIGFLTVYVWIAWKEQTLLRRSAWFVLVMSFGNMAVSVYVLWQLAKLPPGSCLFEILTLRNEPGTVTPWDES
ncbi:MAG: DUF1475 family protein [Fuerstiella sp.]|nr:DUF1475 family protein [Fuerstiella sp.]